MTYYTHSGLFHCDEVAGFAICRLAGICDSFERVSDIQNLPGDGLVADIGREYSPDTNRFDHHQALMRRPNGYPFATAGLLWRHFAPDAVFNALCDTTHATYPEMIALVDIDAVAKRVDETLLQGIDAHDSDNDYSVDAACSSGAVRVYTLSNIVSLFNADDVKDDEAQRDNFHRASIFVEYVLKKAIQGAAQSISDAVRFEEIAQIDGDIAILPENVRWKEVVHEKHPGLKYVISPSLHPGSPFSMIAVPIEPSSRVVKNPIERPDWFSSFIHLGKWIAGANSVEELKKLAKHNLRRYTHDITNIRGSC